MSIERLCLDVLIHVADQLTGTDLVQWIHSSQLFRPLVLADGLWKKRCRDDYGLEYNHPRQSYCQLYVQTSLGTYARRPCRHLGRRISAAPPCVSGFAMATPEDWNALTCCRCSTHGMENLLLCLDCGEILCDRHARLHSQLLTSDEGQHYLFYKPNMAELFCQICVDWLGGCEHNPSEQYHASRVSMAWATALYSTETCAILLKLRSQRRYERSLRWKDTPRRALQDGICFVSAVWIAKWENFVEGWTTNPPAHAINHAQWQSKDGLQCPVIQFNPFALDLTDVVIISSTMWDYLVKVYGLQGSKITEDDLKPPELYKTWHQRLAYWKKSVA